MDKQTSTHASSEATKGGSVDLKDRIRGVILGAACANSLGGSCVNLNHKDILASAGAAVRDFVPGLSRSAFPDHKPGAWLSDTFLAVVLAQSLIENKGKYVESDLKERLKRLLEDTEFLGAGPGAYCLALIRRAVDGIKPQEDVPEALHVSGAARAIVVGCLPNSGNTQNIEEIAVAQARLTQADCRVHSAAAVLADSVHFFLMGKKLDTEAEVRGYVHRHFSLAEKIDSRFAESWDDVAPDLDYANPATELPYSLVNIGSDVGELVPTAVGIFLIFRHSLEEAICAAAVAGGDTDTLALIVGALSGAYHGAGAIPERWLSKIDKRNQLEEVAEGFIALWSH
ncbi:MAG TPA: ADP-ribosylglycohydrolase family protein [Candidatus Obscuribacterales bacterium]